MEKFKKALTRARHIPIASIMMCLLKALPEVLTWIPEECFQRQPDPSLQDYRLSPDNPTARHGKKGDENTGDEDTGDNLEVELTPSNAAAVERLVKAKKQLKRTLAGPQLVPFPSTVRSYLQALLEVLTGDAAEDFHKLLDESLDNDSLSPDSCDAMRHNEDNVATEIKRAFKHPRISVHIEEAVKLLRNIKVQMFLQNKWELLSTKVFGNLLQVISDELQSREENTAEEKENAQSEGRTLDGDASLKLASLLQNTVEFLEVRENRSTVTVMMEDEDDQACWQNSYWDPPWSSVIINWCEEEVLPVIKGEETTEGKDVGDRDTGHKDTEDETTGIEEAGDEDTGDKVAGDEDAEDKDAGDEGTGDGNKVTGDEDTGDEDTGDNPEVELTPSNAAAKERLVKALEEIKRTLAGPWDVPFPSTFRFYLQLLQETRPWNRGLQSDFWVDDAALKIDDPALKMDDTDMRMDDADTKMDGIDMKVDDQALRTDDTDMKMDDIALKMDDPALKMDDSDLKVGDEVVKMDDTALKMDDTSMELDDTDKKMDETALKANDTAMKMDDTDTKMDDTDMEVDVGVVKMDDTDMKLDGTKTKVNTATEMVDKILKMLDTIKEVIGTTRKMDYTDINWNPGRAWTGVMTSTAPKLLCLLLIASLLGVGAAASVTVQGRGRAEQSKAYSLTCVVQDLPGMDATSPYIWYKDGDIIREETKQILTFSRLTQRDAGMYQCGPKRSRRLRFLLSQPSQLRVQNANVGQDIIYCRLNPAPADFSWTIPAHAINSEVVVVSPRGEELFTWTRDFPPLDEFTFWDRAENVQVEGANIRFSLTEVWLEDDGHYSCREGSISGPVIPDCGQSLHYIALPRPGAPQMKLTVEGERGLVICIGRLPLYYLDLGLELYYEWFKDGQLIPGQRGSYLFLDPAQQSDSGWYACRVREATRSCEASPVSRRSRIEIKVPPHVRVEGQGKDSNLEVPEGGGLNLTCKIEAASPPVPPNGFSWTFSPSDSSPAQQLRETGDTLTLGPLTREDSGQYTCQARNDQNVRGRIPPGHDSITVTVIYLDKMQLTPAHVKVKEGESFTLTCNVESSSTVHLQWLVHGDLRREMTTNFDSYNVPKATSGDAGHYTCRATNGDKLQRSASTTVTVIGRGKGEQAERNTETDGEKSPDNATYPPSPGGGNCVSSSILLVPLTTVLVLLLLQ